MNITSITAAYFSPCGSTKDLVLRAARIMAEELGVRRVRQYDFTLPSVREDPEDAPRPGADELLVIGLPTYAGRVPNLILPFVREAFQGAGGPAAVLTTYGNRSFDDSLMELRNVMQGAGFLVFAGAAVTSRHVFSDVLGNGRPDDGDRTALDAWSRDAASLLHRTAAPDLAAVTPVQVPGNDPVGPYYQIPGFRSDERRAFLKAKPDTSEACVRCGLCARHCPTGAIDPEDPMRVTGRCMKCCSCVRRCPNGAKRFTDPAFLAHRDALERDFAGVRGKSEFFISRG